MILENGLIIFDDINEAIYAPTRENKLKQPPLVSRTEMLSGGNGSKQTAVIKIVNPKTY